MGFAPPLSPLRIRQLSILRERAVGRIFTRGWVAPTAGRTFRDIIAVEAPYSWARFWYGNDSATAWTVDEAKWSPTSRTDVTYAADATGVAVTHRNVLFNASGAESLPGATSGAVATLTVPAGAADNPTYVCSDWMEGRSFPRFDGGAFPLVMHSAYCVGAPRGPGTGNSDPAGWDAPSSNFGRVWKTYTVGGSAAGATDDRFAASPTFYRNLAAVEVLYTSPGINLMTLGDSLSQGQGSTSGYTAVGLRSSVVLSTQSKPVTHINAGWSGQSSAQILARGMADISRFKPSVVVISCWTPNDALTQAAADTAFSRAIALANFARSFNVVPVLWTPFPTTRIANGTQEAARMDTVNRLRAMSTNGQYLVADFDAVTSDGASPARLRPAYDSGDGTHLSDAGYQACADMALTPLLRRII